MRPDFLAIGHVARDLTPDGSTIGGAVTYGSLTAKALGLSPAVVTSASPDIDLRLVLGDIPFHRVLSHGTTTFLNTYLEGRRTQLIKEVGGPISLPDVPAEWREAPLVLLCPLAGELGGDMARGFPGSTVVASIQGWLRQWDDEGRVRPRRWDGSDVLPYVHAAVLSHDDIDNERLLDAWKAMTPVLVFTRGREGVNVHLEGRRHHVDAFPSKEVDPTGAGDVFSASYLVRYSETRDVLEAVRFACCAASFCVEAPGTQGIPTRAQVEARLRAV